MVSGKAQKAMSDAAARSLDYMHHLMRTNHSIIVKPARIPQGKRYLREAVGHIMEWNYRRAWWELPLNHDNAKIVYDCLCSRFNQFHLSISDGMKDYLKHE